MVGAAGMLGGAAAVLARARGRPREAEPHYVTHLFVLLAAFTAYLTMALDQGRVLVPDAETGLRPLFYARYVDWAFTTPALLFALASTALGTASRRPALVAGLVLADLFMVLAGAFASLTTHTASKWTWYLVSCAFFGAVLLLVWGPLRRDAEAQPSPQVAQAYRADARLLTALWLAYPVVWALGRTGVRAIGGAAEAGAYAVLDLTAKVAYGLASLARAGRLEPHRAHYAPVEEPIPARAAAPAPRAGA